MNMILMSMGADSTLRNISASLCDGLSLATNTVATVLIGYVYWYGFNFANYMKTVIKLAIGFIGKIWPGGTTRLKQRKYFPSLWNLEPGIF
jgi:hypothetical protein